MHIVESKRSDQVAKRAEEAALVDRAQNGDDQAFAILVSRYRNRIYNFAYRYTRDHAQAEDLTQEVFLRAYKNINKFRGDSKFSTWLFQITKNLALNHLTNWRRKMRVWFKGEDEDGNAHTIEDMPSEDESQDDLIARKELGSMLERSIQNLAPHFRMPLILRDVEGLSYEEIADVMDLPPGTIKSRIHRARNEIKLAMLPYMEHGGLV